MHSRAIVVADADKIACLRWIVDVSVQIWKADVVLEQIANGITAAGTGQSAIIHVGHPDVGQTCGANRTDRFGRLALEHGGHTGQGETVNNILIDQIGETEAFMGGPTDRIIVDADEDRPLLEPLGIVDNFAGVGRHVFGEGRRRCGCLNLDVGFRHGSRRDRRVGRRRFDHHGRFGWRGRRFRAVAATGNEGRTDDKKNEKLEPEATRHRLRV